MAKDLRSLIRLAQWEVDEKRRQLGRRLDELAALEEQLANLEAQLIAEQRVAGRSTEAAFTYGNFSRAVIMRRERLRQAIAIAGQKVTLAQDVLAEAYRELKTYEESQRLRDSRDRAEADRRERIELDEIGLASHRLKQRE